MPPLKKDKMDWGFVGVEERWPSMPMREGRKDRLSRDHQAGVDCGRLC